MKVILSHATGNANVRETAKAFAEANILGSFHTAVASFPGSAVDRIGAFGPFSEIRRRRFSPMLKPYTRTYPWFEVGRLAANKLGWMKLTSHTSGIFNIDAVYRSLDKHVAAQLGSVQSSGINAVYAYEDGAKYSFAEAKKYGLQCLYDLPTGYWRSARRLLKNEEARWPEWMPTLTGFSDSEEKLLSKDAELEMADQVFVASKFTASTLADYPGSDLSIKIIPYGFPLVTGTDATTSGINTPLKLLFVGKLTQQKGIADLFAAVETLKDYVSLTVVGQKAGDDCPALDTELNKHRWIPSLNHGDILKTMREHDVLIFPSLFDGFGLVITEAMSQGTPVIASERSAGPDLIEHGENGWLFKAGSTMALKEVIEEILLKPERIVKISRAAMETAQNRPWEIYRRELVEAVLNQRTFN